MLQMSYDIGHLPIVWILPLRLHSILEHGYADPETNRFNRSTMGTLIIGTGFLGPL